MKLLRRLLWLLLLALLPFPAMAAGTRPNILILLADDLGYADVGFNGGQIIRTPNLDRLAATGVVLSDFRSCPMCSPTRAGLLTGRWPHRFGLMRAVVPPWSKFGLPPEEKTLAELLAERGYQRRALVGKWHLGHARRELLPLAQGFTRFYGHYNGAVDYFTHEREGQCDWHDDERTLHESGYTTDLLATEAVRFIEQSPAEEPWLLYVPFNAPHGPFQTKPDDQEKYARLKMPKRRTYAAMVDSLDQAVGRILRAVEARTDADNTLILFASDNGGIPNAGSSNAPYRGAKLSVYEGGTRVCAAMRWPTRGISGGRRFNERIGYIDVVPTLLAAVGGDTHADLDGVDFLPALQGEAPLPRRPWFSYIHQSAEAQASVHLGDWKLVVHGDVLSEKPGAAPSIELYNIADDVLEKRDLARAHSDKVAELQRLLRQWMSQGRPGVASYEEGQQGFVAPKDWLIFQ
jgi:arylsulfatase A-like enzyme